MNDKIKIEKLAHLKSATIDLSASKSESNRALIIKALADAPIDLHNLSNARDTKIMQQLLQSNEMALNVKDAGTTMRFLTAYCTSQNRETILKGTPRMHERPIKILVEALHQLGAKIEYLENEGYPPIKIYGLEQQKVDFLKVRGDISSQYISALLMIAPTLHNGLTLQLEGKVGSWPYITMTLNLMEHFGVNAQVNDHVIKVYPQQYIANDYSIESDWSGASYYYSFVALAQDASCLLPGLRQNSFQGDQAIVEMMQLLGVETTYEAGRVVLKKKDHAPSATFDFTNCPDLAQTVAVVAAAKGIAVKMTGLESLRIKETDRIAALQAELAKIGGQLLEQGNSWHLIPSKKLPESVTIETYEDHRMAMAFAPLATKMQVIVEGPDVVQKSFPDFWQEVAKLGFTIY